MPEAEFLLGYLYMLGRGVPQDFQKSMYLLGKSRYSGYKDAGALIDAISVFILKYYEKGLSPEIQNIIQNIKKVKCK